jgi:hypothetical protein
MRIDVARLRTVVARSVAASVVAVTIVGAAIGGASAAEPSGPITTGASNGGIASASSDGEINIGQVITGENTGNSIMTGNISGPAELHGGEIDYPTNVNVTQGAATLISTADGGDLGHAAAPVGDGPQVDIDIDNEDRNRNDNRSNATGIGEGGEGGDVIIGDEPVE